MPSHPLHGEYEAKGTLQRVGLPGQQVGVEIGGAADLPQNPLLFHQLIVGQLGAILGVGDVLRADTGKQLAMGGDATTHGDEEQADLTPSQFFETDDVEAPTLFRHACLGLAHAPDVLRQVTVPGQGVVGEVEVGIDDQHGLASSLGCHRLTLKRCAASSHWPLAVKPAAAASRSISGSEYL